MILPHLPVAASAAVLVLAFGAADRAWGAGAKRSLVIPAILVLALVGGWVAGVSLALIWVIYRSISFAGGASAPENAIQGAAALLRHVLVLVPIAGLVVLLGLPEVQAGVSFGAYALVAWVLALIYGGIVKKARKVGLAIGSENAFVEVIRGLAYGAATWVAITPWSQIQSVAAAR